uniref:Uncharacterized protein n=1 Tax=Romanomermis culicivorax TaxID=13658 RepID=A0A915KAF1_ROMCU
MLKLKAFLKKQTVVLHAHEPSLLMGSDLKTNSERRESPNSAVSSNSENLEIGYRRSRNNSLVDWNRIVYAYKEEPKEQFV